MREKTKLLVKKLVQKNIEIQIKFLLKVYNLNALDSHVDIS